MRQIGTLDDEKLAERFVDYLTTEDISAMCEQDEDNWLIWVRDENQLDTAREELQRFVENPEAEEYRKVHRQAADLRIAQRKRRRQAKKNFVQVRGNWDAPLTKRAPLVVAMIVISVGVGILSNLSLDHTGTTQRLLMFVDPGQEGAGRDVFINIRHGQVWRLATPVFLHGGAIHLIFNMLWLYYLGGQIEAKRGSARFFFMVLLIAVLSNALQAIVVGPLFGGMSGVVFGLFGYIWLRRREGYLLSTFTIAFVMFFFVLGFAGFPPNVANMAHGAGLVIGLAMGYYPELFSGRRRRPGP